MQTRGIRTLIMTMAAVALATAASACPNCKKNYAFGPPVAIGNGMAFSYVKFSKEGKVESIGVTLTETALSGLPTVEQMADPKMPTMEYVLELPRQVKGLPFDHIGVDWNPVGHEPARIYDVPHFDIHFYTISRETRQQITLQGENAKIAAKRPDARFIPAGYILPPVPPVPNMGLHWIDPKSPEFNGNPFTTTFLYGSYNGKSAFWEPMITKAFLESKPDFTQPLGLPQAFDHTGYFPGSYSIKYNGDRKEISVSLDNLVYAQAQTSKPSAAAKKAKKR